MLNQIIKAEFTFNFTNHLKKTHLQIIIMNINESMYIGAHKLVEIKLQNVSSIYLWPVNCR